MFLALLGICSLRRTQLRHEFDSRPNIRAVIKTLLSLALKQGMGLR